MFGQSDTRDGRMDRSKDKFYNKHHVLHRFVDPQQKINIQQHDIPTS